MAARILMIASPVLAAIVYAWYPKNSDVHSDAAGAAPATSQAATHASAVPDGSEPRLGVPPELHQGGSQGSAFASQ